MPVRMMFLGPLDYTGHKLISFSASPISGILLGQLIFQMLETQSVQRQVEQKLSGAKNVGVSFHHLRRQQIFGRSCFSAIISREEEPRKRIIIKKNETNTLS